MTEAAGNIPWLPSCETLIARVARHLGCAPKAAELRIVSAGKSGLIKGRGAIEIRPAAKLRIVGEGKGGRTKTCGVIETWLVSPLRAAWNGTRDLAGATMKPPRGSYVITSLELCFIDLVAANLLPTPVEKAQWPADEAIAYLVKGVPLPWEAWHEAVLPAEIEQGEIDLAELIFAGVPAQGRLSPFGPWQQIPAGDFDPRMIENKALPVSVAHRPKVAVNCQGSITTSPRQRLADYRGPPWQAIKVDSAALRQACPRPLPTQAESTALPRVEPVPSSPKLSAQELPPEEAEQQPDEPQFEGPRKWQPDEVPEWFRHVRTTYPRKPGETKSAYAHRLHEHMTNDFEIPPWSDAETVRRRLNDPDYA
jgi:hypothetical protein